MPTSIVLTRMSPRHTTPGNPLNLRDEGNPKILRATTLSDMRIDIPCDRSKIPELWNKEVDIMLQHPETKEPIALLLGAALPYLVAVGLLGYFLSFLAT